MQRQDIIIDDIPHTIHFVTMTHLSCNWKRAPLNLPYLFLSSPHSLPSGEIKLSAFIGSWRKQRNSRKTSASVSLTMLKPLTVWITTSCGKFLKRWKYQPTIPVSWGTCLHVKKHQLKLDMEQWTDSKLGKEYVKAVFCQPCLFNLYAEYIMRNAGVLESQAGIKISRRNINNLRYVDDTILMAESEEERN